MIDWLKDNLTRRRHLDGCIANELRNTYPLTSVGIAAKWPSCRCCWSILVNYGPFASFSFLSLAVELQSAVRRMKEDNRQFSLMLSLFFLLLHTHTYSHVSIVGQQCRCVRRHRPFTIVKTMKTKIIYSRISPIKHLCGGCVVRGN